MQLEDVRAQYRAWLMDKLPTARALHESSDSICNSTAKRLVSIFVNQNLDLADDEQINRYRSQLLSIIDYRSSLHCCRIRMKTMWVTSGLSFFLSLLGWHTLSSHACSAEACPTGWPSAHYQGRD